MKTALITGGLGFVGQRLCEKLLSEGYKVKIFSRGTYKGPKRENVEVVKVDYSNIAALRANLEGGNVVFHLAACLFGYNYQDFYKANVVLTKNLCAAAQGVFPHFSRNGAGSAGISQQNALGTQLYALSGVERAFRRQGVV